MRNKLLTNTAAILNALESESLTRPQLEERLAARGVNISKDALTNLLLDLQELN